MSNGQYKSKRHLGTVRRTLLGLFLATPFREHSMSIYTVCNRSQETVITYGSEPEETLCLWYPSYG